MVGTKKKISIDISIDPPKVEKFKVRPMLASSQTADRTKLSLKAFTYDVDNNHLVD